MFEIPLYAREAFAVADKRYQVKITAVTEFLGLISLYIICLSALR
jgi:hypothetical protein